MNARAARVTTKGDKRDNKPIDPTDHFDDDQLAVIGSVVAVALQDLADQVNYQVNDALTTVTDALYASLQDMADQINAALAAAGAKAANSTEINLVHRLQHEVLPPPAPLVRRRVERDKRGDITGTVEEPV